ncbi:signal recognition particle protein [Spiroplasma platyhelix]|uniref:Signal recognition particle protein n=1 Tax=Spiroplasma platyhelix PALS-1 TaxID=1276218 RepID=A0A846TZV1_9MOLU|nr:signal recognition particle protein [Spiroplasma platyhelix]MBE4703931.1 Signal recognition particle protein [Spiroplasma platyhelix PALS-1]NKE38304.1 signal recognition particle protein [Spiroplasma platyhelix PALS-1]UJB29189.1 signal recognition particle protein [Spiroplasma platyhelix PALS-1]
MSFADIMAKKMQKTLEKNINKKTLTSENIEAFLKDLRVILLESDVSFKVVKDLINQIRAKALGEYVKEGLDQQQMLMKIIHEEFSNIMGAKNIDLNLSSKPAVVMVAGLQGSGKTTTVAKLANHIIEKLHKSVLLVAGDTYRLAAVDQLKTLGKQLNIEVYHEENQKPQQIAINAKKYAQEKGIDVVLVDTAGRLHIDEALMTELTEMQNAISPDDVLLVIDGMAGQEMVNIAQTFMEKINVRGFIITKMDGSAKGGIALSLSYLTKLPIKFLGMGEKVRDLEIFYPKRMADRILGMGDIETLIEKAQSNFSERDVKDTMDRMMLGQFDLNDLLNQMKQVKNMGKLGSLAKMVPGLAAKVSDSKISEAENDVAIAEIIISSTTVQERKKPQLLRYPTRKNRILKGSGRTEKELNKLLSQYEKTKKVMDRIAGQVKAGQMPDFPGLDNLLNLQK